MPKDRLFAEDEENMEVELPYEETLQELDFSTVETEYEPEVRSSLEDTE